MRRGRSGAPGAVPLLTWRSLGPGWGIRVRASPRARCAPGRRRPPARPAPALAAALALHGARRLARGPGKLVLLAAALRALATCQWLLAFPRPASARPSSASALFPPLPRTGQTGFSAPGWCLLFPSRSRGPGSQQGRGAGPTVGPPFVPPGGGEGLDRESLGEQTRPRLSPVPSVCPGGRWAPWPWPPPRPFRDLAAVAAFGFPGAPASQGAALATPPHQPRVTFPLPSSVLATTRGR